MTVRCLSVNSEGMGIDWLSALEILARLEKKYEIIVPDRDLRNINGAMDIVRLISKELERKRQLGNAG